MKTINLPPNSILFCNAVNNICLSNQHKFTRRQLLTKLFLFVHDVNKNDNNVFMDNYARFMSDFNNVKKYPITFTLYQLFYGFGFNYSRDLAEEMRFIPLLQVFSEKEL